MEKVNFLREIDFFLSDIVGLIGVVFCFFLFYNFIIEVRERGATV